MIRKKPIDKSPNRHQSPLWQKCKNLQTLKQIHASMIVNGFNSNQSSLRELIFASSVAVSGTLNYAHKLFAQITEPDTFMWNTIIRGSVTSPNPSKSILYYTQMEKSEIKPDNYTFPFLLKACAKLFWVKMGCQIHSKVVKFGFESDRFVKNTLIYFHSNCGDLNIATSLFYEYGSDDGCVVKNDVVAWSALISGYAKRGELGVARKLFDEMPVKDLISWNVMITGYAKRGEMDCGRKLFDQVVNKDVVTWNAMIAGYVLSGEHKQALDMFEEMKFANVVPDEVTMLSLLSACADLGDLDIGQNIHRSLLDMCVLDLTVVIGNAVIDMYAKCGSIEKALEVFRGMKRKDVSSWNSVIGGLAFHGHGEESIKMFDKMRNSSIRPDEITFVAVLVACSHAGEVDMGRQYFKIMKDQYNIEPKIKHCGCMVDILGRNGLLKEAFEFVEMMLIEPNAIVWRTLLGACKIYGEVELGRRANIELLKLRKDQSGDYVLLSNIYASKGEWGGAEKVRKMMDDSGVKKEVGCSLIEGDDDSKALMTFLFDSKAKSNSR